MDSQEPSSKQPTLNPTSVRPRMFSSSIVTSRPASTDAWRELKPQAVPTTLRTQLSSDSSNTMSNPLQLEISMEDLARLEWSMPTETLLKSMRIPARLCSHRSPASLDQRHLERPLLVLLFVREPTWSLLTSMSSLRRTDFRMRTMRQLLPLWSKCCLERLPHAFFWRISHRANSRLNSSSRTVLPHHVCSSSSVARMSARKEWSLFHSRILLTSHPQSSPRRLDSSMRTLKSFLNILHQLPIWRLSTLSRSWMRHSSSYVPVSSQLSSL